MSGLQMAVRAHRHFQGCSKNTKAFKDRNNLRKIAYEFEVEDNEAMTAIQFVSDAEWLVYCGQQAEYPPMPTYAPSFATQYPCVIADAYFAVQMMHVLSEMRDQYQRRRPGFVGKQKARSPPFEFTAAKCYAHVEAQLLGSGTIVRDAQQSVLLTAVGLAAQKCKKWSANDDYKVYNNEALF